MRKRERKGGISPFKAGLIAIIAIVVFAYLGFTKFANPFASQYTVHAVFSNANGLKPDSLVRIAGINVGKVTERRAGAGLQVGGTPQKTAAGGPASSARAADVTMAIDNGLPIHKDATFAIRPRIFLEGNFFVDVQPGHARGAGRARRLHVPDPAGDRAGAVRPGADLAAVRTRARTCRRCSQQYGTALKKGGPSYNASIKYWLPAYEYSAIVAHDALGIEPHDLSNAINDQGDGVRRDRHPPAEPREPDHGLQHDRGAFARENVSLSKRPSPSCRRRSRRRSRRSTR